MTHLNDYFEEFQWRMNWLQEPLQKTNLHVANGVWEAGLRPPKDFHVQFFQGEATDASSVAWMSADCGNDCWTAVVKMADDQMTIGTNWRKTSGRRARALADAGVFHGVETGDICMQKTIWCLHRCVYLMYLMTHESKLTKVGDEVVDIKSCDDLWALIVERLPP